MNTSSGKRRSLKSKNSNNSKKLKLPNKNEDSNNINSNINSNINIISSIEDAEDEVNKLKHSDPVLQLNLPSPSQLTSPNSIPDIILNSSPSPQLSLLETLLYPLSPKTFLTTCFRKKAVHIQSNNIHRVDKLNSKYMFNLDVKQIYEETSSDSIFLWIRSSSSSNPNSNSNNKNDSNNNANADEKVDAKSKSDAQPLQSIEIQDPDMAHLLHTSSNYASYCRAPPELEQPLVYNMLKDTGIGCGQYETNSGGTGGSNGCSSMGRGEVETFIGTKNHITDWHTDFQENFTIQLSGCKKWYLKQSSLKHPLRGMTPHYKNTKDVIENQMKSSKLSTPNFVYGKQDLDSNAFGNEEVITMYPGDVLYFPAGMWHKVETVEYGVSINISLMGSNFASIVCGAMEHLLLKRDEWREVICNKNTSSNTNNNADSAKNTHESDVVVEKLDSLLAGLPDIIRDFHQKGGAHCILPPVMRRAPNYVIANDEWEENDDDNGDDNISIEIEEETLIENEGEEESCDRSNLEDDGDGNNLEEDGDKDDDNSNGSNEENIIDINSFQCPEKYSRPSLNHKLVKNPLATMMPMTDITSFNSDNDTQEKDRHFYILNVSYAGNEMHESCVRTVFFDDSGMLESFCTIDQSGVDESDQSPYQDALSDASPPDALFYYGYFNWVQ